MKNFLAACGAAALLCFVGCKKDETKVEVLANPTDGQIVVSTYGSLTKSAVLQVLDKNGQTINQKTTPYAAINFSKWQVNGVTRYSYMEFDPNVTQLSQGILPTTAVLLDANLQELKRIRLLPFNGRTASDVDAVDAHDFIYLGDNHYLVMAYFQKVVTNIPGSLNPVSNCKVVAPIIQEVNNGQVVWEWDGSNFPEFYLHSVEGNDFSNAAGVHDYVHINSIFIDPTDNNVIASLRNLNQVIKINRSNGSILWRLGGTNSDFPMTTDMKFLRQHHVTLTDDNKTLLFFDNGEAKERPYSRVLEFGLAQDSKAINTFKAYNLPDNLFSQYMGSVQKRGNTYFIGAGSEPKIMEVDYTTDKITFLMKLPNVSYRALKN